MRMATSHAAITVDCKKESHLPLHKQEIAAKINDFSGNRISTFFEASSAAYQLAALHIILLSAGYFS